MQDYEAGIEEMITDYRERLRTGGDLARQLAGVTATAESPRRSVRVSVDVHGVVTAPEFPTMAFKRMDSTDPADAIVRTTAAAKAKMVESMKTMLLPTLPPGFDPFEAMQR